MRLPIHPARRGISLLEALIAAAILFISIAAISQLVSIADRQVIQIRQRSIATQLCESKLNEVVAGVVPLGPASGTFAEAPEWEWSVQAAQSDVAGLWDVVVEVGRIDSTDAAARVVLSQKVLDPTLRGSTMDTTTITGTDEQQPEPTGGTTPPQGSGQ